MTRDEFDLWRVNPVTQWVFRGLRRASAQEETEWQRVSWANGVANQRVLDQLRDRANTLLELEENTFENWLEWNGEADEQERD